jgi:7,8-dihydroneopterin aldolase/epimerase/oxygenase
LIINPVYCQCAKRFTPSAHNWKVDRILLEGMSFHGRHGVRTAERERPQEFKVDIEVDCDLSRPGISDRIEDTVDYTMVRAIAKEVIEGESHKLLETLAARIADRVLQLEKVGGVSVRIAKRPESMQPIAAAAVRINRTRA